MSTLTHDATAARAESRAISATDGALLILRLALGVIFFAHGGQKVFGWFGGPGLSAIVSGFGQMGIPAPLAYLAAFTELFGGLGMIFGVLSRLSGLGLAITMVVAALKVHLPNGFFLNSPGGDGFEYNLALFAMALAILVAGPGRLAIGDWEARFFRKNQSS